ncbi:MAG: T9SS type A sorting domain-containing protein [Bacteroidales bacterium]|nr:T9SS type A sorting domain-containing protein [Bacteroidales bacterium]
MKNKYYYLILGVYFIVFLSSSMAQQPVFNRVYYNLEEGFHILGSDKSADNGYILGGIQYSGSGHVIKIDSAGNPEWAKQVSTSEINFEIRDVICNPDSTIVSAGVVNSNTDLLNVIKWAKSGDTLWSKNIEGLNYIQELRIKRPSSGGYLITASNSDYYSLSNVEGIALKLNDTGELMWSKRYTSDDHLIYLSSIAELPDNNLIICGYRSSKTTNVRNLSVILADENGNVLWAESLTESGGYTYSEAEDIAVTQDGIVLYTNYYGNFLSNGGLIKMDFAGNPLWAKNYSLENYHIWSNSRGNFAQTPDSGFAIVSSRGGDGQLLKTDESGIPLWSQAIFMDPIDVNVSSDHGYMVLGNGPIPGLKLIPENIPQIGAYKTDSSGNGGDCVFPLIIQSEDYTAVFENFTVQASDIGNLVNYSVSINDFQFLVEGTCVAHPGNLKHHESGKKKLKLYPNPSNGSFSIELPANMNMESAVLQITGYDGQLVYATKEPSFIRNGINPGYLPDGIYLVRLITEKNSFSGKLIIKH